MQIEHIVVDASPLICLLKSGLLDLLPKLFTEIIVPDKVYQEVTAKGAVNLPTINHLKQIGNINISESVASWDLGKGESSVLSFAMKNSKFYAVIDDREARRCAASLGCHHIGTVGIILLAKRRGIVSSVKDSLNKLQAAGLWLSDSFIKEVCLKVRED